MNWIGATGALSAAVWIGLVTFHYKIQPVSRRACNAAYVLWITALYLSIMWLDTLVLLLRHFFAAPEWFPHASPDRSARVETISPRSLSTTTPTTAKGLLSKLSQPLFTKSSPQFPVQAPQRATTSTATPIKHAMMPESLQLLSTNMLTTFIVANILTGIINMGMDTRGCDIWFARLTILLYIVAVHSLPIYMNAMDDAG